MAADDQRGVEPVARTAPDDAVTRRVGVSRSVRRRMAVRLNAGTPATRAGSPAVREAEPQAPSPVLRTAAEEPAGEATEAATEEVAETAGDARTAGTATGSAAGVDTVAAEPGGAGGRRPARADPRAWRIAAAVLTLLLVAGLVVAGITGRSWWDQRQLDRAHQQALAAARQTTVNFMSISAATVDRDLRRISDGATGDFKDEFTRDTAQVKAAVIQNKVDSRGNVLRAALVSGDRRRAVVLVAIDATIHNVAAKDGRLLHYRVRVDLTHDGRSGRWLVSQLQFVG